MLADRLGNRAKGRSSLPRFRGQFEPLESRTVLSATIGLMAIDFEANTVTVAIWHEPTPPAGWLPNVHFDSSPSLAFGATNRTWFPESGRGGRQFFQQGAIGLAGNNYVGNNYVGNSQVDAGGFYNEPSSPTAADMSRPPLKGTADKEPAPSTGAGNSNQNFAPKGEFVNSTVSHVRYARNIPTDSLAFDTAYTTSIAPTTSRSNSSTLETTDAAFDKYATNSLLLATTAGLHGDNSLDDEFDEADSPDDKPSTNDASKSFAAEEVSASLDALRRERHAIDEVLAELHEVKLKENHRQDARDAEHANREDSRSVAKEFSLGEERREQEMPSTPAEGMVLLHPSGDANESAYDLTDVFFARLGGDEHAPLAVEASLGMFQAIDIGEQPAANRAQFPVAQPDQAARPSISAENAPAKKSEQPT